MISWGPLARDLVLRWIIEMQVFWPIFTGLCGKVANWVLNNFCTTISCNIFRYFSDDDDRNEPQVDPFICNWKPTTSTESIFEVSQYKVQNKIIERFSEEHLVKHFSELFFTNNWRKTPFSNFLFSTLSTAIHDSWVTTPWYFVGSLGVLLKFYY